MGETLSLPDLDASSAQNAFENMIDLESLVYNEEVLRKNKDRSLVRRKEIRTRRNRHEGEGTSKVRRRGGTVRIEGGESCLGKSG